jgi:hypothetical protein
MKLAIKLEKTRKDHEMKSWANSYYDPLVPLWDGANRSFPSSSNTLVLLLILLRRRANKKAVAMIMPFFLLRILESGYFVKTLGCNCATR